MNINIITIVLSRCLAYEIYTFLYAFTFPFKFNLAFLASI
jgi:hypothetical protein